MENLNIYTIKSLLHAREGNLSFARQMSEADLRKLKTGLVRGGRWGEGWDSSLQPGNEPNKTHNRTKTGHRTDLNIPHQTELGHN